MGDASELGKRAKYFKNLLQSTLFVKASSDVQTRLLQASRIPAVGSWKSGKSFDFRDEISRILETASRLENPTAYLVSLARLYERLRINWFLTEGNPAILYTHYSPYPILEDLAYGMASAYVFYPDRKSAEKLDGIPMHVSRSLRGEGLTVDHRLFPKRPYRAELGGPATRRWSVYEGTRFETEDVHVAFDDHQDITIRIPTTQRVLADAHAPKLAQVISALGLLPGTLRRQPSEMVILPIKGYSDKVKRIRLIAFYARSLQSLNFLQTIEEDTWEGNSDPAVTLFHEYGHLIFFQNLRLAEKNSTLVNEYRNAVVADKADISEYGRESLSEDFAEAFALLRLLELVPCRDLENAFEILYPNRHAFFQKYVSNPQ